MDRLDYNLAGKRSRQQTISFEELEETFSDTPNLTEGIELGELTEQIKCFLGTIAGETEKDPGQEIFLHGLCCSDCGGYEYEYQLGQVDP